jgi:hypothetical protein
MKKMVYLIFVFLLSTPLTTYAETDGNSLLKRCSNVVLMADGKHTGVDEFEAGYCFGLISATAIMSTKGYGICAPVTATTLQMSKVVIKFLNENPDKLHMHDTFLVLMAMENAWPCPKDKK